MFYNGKNIYKWVIVHCHVWLPDGISNDYLSETVPIKVAETNIQQMIRLLQNKSQFGKKKTSKSRFQVSVHLREIQYDSSLNLSDLVDTATALNTYKWNYNDL